MFPSTVLRQVLSSDGASKSSTETQGFKPHRLEQDNSALPSATSWLWVSITLQLIEEGRAIKDSTQFYYKSGNMPWSRGQGANTLTKCWGGNKWVTHFIVYTPCSCRFHYNKRITYSTNSIHLLLLVEHHQGLISSFNTTDFIRKVSTLKHSAETKNAKQKLSP